MPKFFFIILLITFYSYQKQNENYFYLANKILVNIATFALQY